jgi:hypothetical protein
MSDFNTIKGVSLNDALLPSADNNRITSNQSISGGIDTRSGNLMVRDSTHRRIVVGQLPDGDYGMVISKSGYDVIDLFSV